MLKIKLNQESPLHLLSSSLRPHRTKCKEAFQILIGLNADDQIGV